MANIPHQKESPVAITIGSNPRLTDPRHQDER